MKLSLILRNLTVLIYFGTIYALNSQTWFSSRKSA